MTTEYQQEPCSLEDLRALVPVYDRWSVDKNGETVSFESSGDSDHSTLDIEEYVCEACGEFFTPDKRYDYTALDIAWKAALAHLPQSEQPS